MRSSSTSDSSRDSSWPAFLPTADLSLVKNPDPNLPLSTGDLTMPRRLSALLSVLSLLALAVDGERCFAAAPSVAVAPQYDTTHVYVAPEDFDRFTASLLATFGGSKSKQGVFQVTPTPSQTMSQLVLTPAGTFSVFGFKTPIPYPFGLERTGYLVSDMDTAVKSAREHGADVVVSIFPDPIGRDAVIAWPGGVYMQLYWHT